MAFCGEGGALRDFELALTRCPKVEGTDERDAGPYQSKNPSGGDASLRRQARREEESSVMNSTKYSQSRMEEPCHGAFRLAPQQQGGCGAQRKCGNRAISRSLRRRASASAAGLTACSPCGVRVWPLHVKPHLIRWHARVPTHIHSPSERREMRASRRAADRASTTWATVTAV